MFQHVYGTNRPILEHSIDITVNYKDSTNRKKEKTFLLTFDKWENYGDNESDPVSEMMIILREHIAAFLDEINHNAEDWITETVRSVVQKFGFNFKVKPSTLLNNPVLDEIITDGGL